MGYAELVRKCEDIFAAERSVEEGQKRVAAMPKAFPVFAYKQLNGDTFVVNISHRSFAFGALESEYPLLEFTGRGFSMSPKLAIALAKWILDVFEGMPEK